MTDPALVVDVSVDEHIPMPNGYRPDNARLVVESVLKHEMAAGEWEVSIVFVGDDELQILHRDYLGDDSPTDIMTFPLGTDDDWAGIGQSTFGGDIVISVDQAARQASDEGWDVLAELRFLVAHGVLHLVGWDDTTTEQRQCMLDCQREILN